MKLYLGHKLLTLFVLAAIFSLGFLLYPTDVRGQWQVLLFALIIFGYSHFIIGAFYQLRSYWHRPNRRYYYFVFTLLTLLSFVSVWLIIKLGGTPLLVVLVIGYFILHGYFNEITLYERQTNRTANKPTIAASMWLLLGLLALSVGHASWFFDPSLEFVQYSQAYMTQYLTLDPLAVIAQITGLASLFVAFVCVLIGWRQVRQHHGWYSLLLLAIAGTAIVTWFWHPFTYITLLALILLYHFIIWFLFYFQQFYVREPKRLYLYLGLHILVLAPFTLLLTESALGTLADSYLVNLHVFLSVTAAHISVSFMNESWFQRMVQLD
jgi:hypothetical protein